MVSAFKDAVGQASILVDAKFRGERGRPPEHPSVVRISKLQEEIAEIQRDNDMQSQEIWQLKSALRDRDQQIQQFVRSGNDNFSHSQANVPQTLNDKEIGDLLNISNQFEQAARILTKKLQIYEAHNSPQDDELLACRVQDNGKIGNSETISKVKHGSISQNNNGMNSTTSTATTISDLPEG